MQSGDVLLVSDMLRFGKYGLYAFSVFCLFKVKRLAGKWKNLRLLLRRKRGSFEVKAQERL